SYTVYISIISLHIIFLFFILLITTPPIFSFFPYTTLFRSPRFLHLNHKIIMMEDKNQQPNQLNIEISEEVAEGEYANLAIITHSDRKSTRLNSSHRTISYAVFCLKKKKKKKNKQIYTHQKK